MLERANDGRPDRHDRLPGGLPAIDGVPRVVRNVVRLVERQTRIQFRIAGRGDARRQRERREFDSPVAHRRHRAPVEDEPRRRRLERDRRARDRRPHIPERQRRRDVRVLKRPPVPREARPDLVRPALEPKRHETWMVEQTGDRGAERSEREPVAGPRAAAVRTMLGLRVEIAGAEHHRGEVLDIVRRQRTSRASRTSTTPPVGT